MYFQRCLNLLITFMEYGEDLVKIVISTNDIMKSLLDFLKTPQNLEKENLNKILIIVEQASITQTKDRLDSIGVIKII